MTEKNAESRVLVVKHNRFYLTPFFFNEESNYTRIGLASVERKVEVQDENGTTIYATEEHGTNELFDENGFYKSFVSNVFQCNISETFNSNFAVKKPFTKRTACDKLIFVPLSEINSASDFSLSTKIADKRSGIGEAFYSAAARNALLFDRNKYDALVNDVPSKLLNKLPSNEIYLMFWNCYNDEFQLCAIQLPCPSSDGRKMTSMIVPYLFNADWVFSKHLQRGLPNYLTNILYMEDGYGEFPMQLLDLLGLNYIGPASLIREDRAMTSLNWKSVEDVFNNSNDYSNV